MLTEREKRIVDWLRREALRVAAETTVTITDEMWAAGERSAYASAADAIERGEHLKRPEPTVPASEWMGKSNVGR